MELLYIWIGDNPIDTLQQEFCFTPEYDIHFDNLKKMYIYSDRVETKFLKRYSNFINKISFQGRDEYIFVEKIIF